MGSGKVSSVFALQESSGAARRLSSTVAAVIAKSV